MKISTVCFAICVLLSCVQAIASDKDRITTSFVPVIIPSIANVQFFCGIFQSNTELNNAAALLSVPEGKYEITMVGANPEKREWDIVMRCLESEEAGSEFQLVLEYNTLTVVYSKDSVFSIPMNLELLTKIDSTPILSKNAAEILKKILNNQSPAKSEKGSVPEI